MLECEWRVAQHGITRHGLIAGAGRFVSGHDLNRASPHKLALVHSNVRFLATKKRAKSKVRGPRKSLRFIEERVEMGLIARHLDFDIPASLHRPSTAGRAKPGALVASPGA